MKAIVEMGHPAHVHQFKNMIRILERKGHEIKICTTDKEVALSLLELYGFKYEVLGINRGGSLMSKIPLLIKSEYNMLKIAKQFKPDLFISRGSPVSAYISKFFHKPHISFYDTEHARLTDILASPFTDVICTPSCFKRDLGKKQVRYNGYHELAYLHPNYFTPNPAVLDELGLSRDDIIILRFVAWAATHDIGRRGFSLETKRKLTNELKKYATIFISSESPLPKEFEKYQLPISLEKIHDLLYYAKLLVCDSQTMTTEAGILGTPAIRCNSFVGENDMSNFIELEQKYGLIFNFNDPDKAINKAIELIQQPNLKVEWQNKKKIILKDKIDVTAFMVWLIENYPNSFKEMKENPEIQYKFK